jgi:hypothetical protein
MTRISRRAMLLGVPAVLLAMHARPGLASGGWIDVTGTAPLDGMRDLSVVRRRAIADALLEAALSGGADVRGHSVLSNTRLTSDLLIVRPTGQILEYRLLTEGQDGPFYRVMLRARVAPAAARACASRRLLHLSVYAPRIQIAAPAPVWVAPIVQDLIQHFVEDSRAHPAVQSVRLLDRFAHPNTAPDRTDYRQLVSGSARATPAGHGLVIEMRGYPQDGSLYLDARLRLDGPEGEALERRVSNRVRLPGVSFETRAAPPSVRDRDRLSADLVRDIRPALQSLLTEAGCAPVQLRLEVSGGRLSVPAGRAHGISQTSLAVTLNRGSVPELFEVTRLSDQRAELAPLDPARKATDFSGHVVRFIDSNEGLP